MQSYVENHIKLLSINFSMAINANVVLFDFIALFLNICFPCQSDQEGRGQWAVNYISPQSFIIHWLNNFPDFY